VPEDWRRTTINPSGSALYDGSPASTEASTGLPLLIAITLRTHPSATDGLFSLHAIETIAFLSHACSYSSIQAQYISHPLTPREELWEYRRLVYAGGCSALRKGGFYEDQDQSPCRKAGSKPQHRDRAR
jgi:hypothetical protein